MAKNSMKEKMAGNLSGSLVASKSGRKALFGQAGGGESKPAPKTESKPVDTVVFSTKIQVPVTAEQEDYLKDQAKILHRNRTTTGQPINQNNLVRALIDICREGGVCFTSEDILTDVDSELIPLIKSRLKASL